MVMAAKMLLSMNDKLKTKRLKFQYCLTNWNRNKLLGEIYILELISPK